MQATETTLHELNTTHPPQSLWKTIVVLFKLRVVSLLVLAAFGGAALGAMAGKGASVGRCCCWLSSVHWRSRRFGNQSIFGARPRCTHESYSVSSAGNGSNRPTRCGTMDWCGHGHLGHRTFCGVQSGTGILDFNGALIYVLVYTVWLKRTTSNIVIGGAAGSCAVLSGGAAMGAWTDPGVLILAALVFVWTPVHFWALALAYRNDYIKADYPMLPARVSPPKRAQHSTLHHSHRTMWHCPSIMAKIDHFPYPCRNSDYFPITRTWQLVAKPETWAALKLFHFSNLYLALVLVVSMFALLEINYVRTRK